MTHLGNLGPSVKAILNHDVLVGGAGYDSLDGGLSDDELSGGLGADFIEAGHGNDTLVNSLGNEQTDQRDRTNLGIGHNVVRTDGEQISLSIGNEYNMLAVTSDTIDFGLSKLTIDRTDPNENLI